MKFVEPQLWNNSNIIISIKNCIKFRKLLLVRERPLMTTWSSQIINLFPFLLHKLQILGLIGAICIGCILWDDDDDSCEYP